MMTQDEYGYVLNSQDTFEYTAAILFHDRSVIFAWTDEAGTQLDILLVIQPVQFGHLQRGMKAYTDLFVSVSHYGMFGFELTSSDLHPGYVGEKLNLGGTTNPTTKKLAELINGVIKELKNRRQV